MYSMWWIAIGCVILTFIGIGLICKYIYMNGFVCFIGLILVAVFGIASVLVIPFAIANPISARKELEKFNQTRIIVEQVYESGNELDNIGITQTMIEANNWLAEARANKKTYGSLSKYYNIDLDEIEPIQIKRGE